MGTWDSDWEAARKRSFTRACAASPAERLAWLGQALRLAASAGALARLRTERDRKRDGTW